MLFKDTKSLSLQMKMETLGMTRRGPSCPFILHCNEQERRRWSFGNERGKIDIVIYRYPLLDFESPAQHPDTGVELLCRDPSVLLGPFFEKIGAAICMSATLEPFDFYQNLLGLEAERTCVHKFDSPFPVQNRASFVLPFVSTLYKHRERENPRIATLLEKNCRFNRGEYSTVLL